VTVAAQLEANLRERVRANLDASRGILIALIRAPLAEVSGQLKAGILCDPWSENGSRYETTVRSLAPYSLWVDQGTGIFGPVGTRIYPRTAKVLAFHWTNRGGGLFFFRSVRGTPAQRFFTDPMADYLSQALAASFN
jgi:hypothetical protein